MALLPAETWTSITTVELPPCLVSLATSYLTVRSMELFVEHLISRMLFLRAAQRPFRSLSNLCFLPTPRTAESWNLTEHSSSTWEQFNVRIRARLPLQILRDPTPLA